MNESVNTQLVLAESLARRVHHGAVDKSGAPYIEHCRRVAAKLTDAAAKVVAWLHDVIEDTDTTADDLRVEFDEAIVDAVVAITRVKGELPADYYRRVRSNPLALQVKLADIHDNLEPSRLAALDDETQRRLLKKYGSALVELSA